MEIQQTLHGYQQGHTLIASSIDLSTADKKKMAILSDWSEYSRGDGSDSSYISAYPLPDSHYYVVARTWYADEMQRPGCVWTHSLLIDTQDIDATFDFRALWTYFKRPTKDKEEFELYELPISVTQNLLDCEVDKPLTLNIPSLGYWLRALLEKSEELIFTATSLSRENQFFLLSLLSHLPIGISQTMSFCSGTARLRQSDGIPFNLQITSASRKKYPYLNAQVIEIPEVPYWYKQLATSIMDGGKEIPILLNKFALDIGNKLVRFQTIIELYLGLDRLEDYNEDKSELFKSTICNMATAFPKVTDGIAFKASILSPSMTKYFCDESSFIAYMATTPYSDSFDYDSFDFWGRVSAYANNQKLEEVLSVMNYLLQFGKKTPVVAKVLERMERTYNVEEMQKILDSCWLYYLYLVKKHGSYLENEMWLTLESQKFSKLVKIFINQPHPDCKEIWLGAFHRLLHEHSDLPYDSIQKFGAYIEVVDIILEEIEKGGVLPYNYISYCKLEAEKIVNWLDGKNTVNKMIQNLICASIQPDSNIVYQSRSSNWHAMLNIPAKMDNLDIFIFIFILAYNLPDKKGAFEFYKKAFYPIYKAAENSNISLEEWQKIAIYCPKPAWGWEWDRCAMLRRGFVNWAIEEHIENSEIQRFTPQKRLNKKLQKYVDKRRNSIGWLPW